MTIIIIGYCEKKIDIIRYSSFKTTWPKKTNTCALLTKFGATAKQGQSNIIHLLILNQQKCLIEWCYSIAENPSMSLVFLIIQRCTCRSFISYAVPLSRLRVTCGGRCKVQVTQADSPQFATAILRYPFSFGVNVYFINLVLRLHRTLYEHTHAVLRSGHIVA